MKVFYFESLPLYGNLVDSVVNDVINNFVNKFSGILVMMSGWIAVTTGVVEGRIFIGQSCMYSC